MNERPRTWPLVELPAELGKLQEFLVKHFSWMMDSGRLGLLLVRADRLGKGGSVPVWHRQGGVPSHGFQVTYLLSPVKWVPEMSALPKETSLCPGRHTALRPLAKLALLLTPQPESWAAARPSHSPEGPLHAAAAGPRGPTPGTSHGRPSWAQRRLLCLQRRPWRAGESPDITRSVGRAESRLFWKIKTLVLPAKPHTPFTQKGGEEKDGLLRRVKGWRQPATRGTSPPANVIQESPDILLVNICPSLFMKPGDQKLPGSAAQEVVILSRLAPSHLEAGTVIQFPSTLDATSPVPVGQTYPCSPSPAPL